eukprot:scpid46934/ scgid3226/ 
MAALRRTLLLCRHRPSGCLATRGFTDYVVTDSSLMEVLKKGEHKEVPKQELWKELSPITTSLGVDGILSLPVEPLGQLLSFAELNKDCRGAMRQLIARPECWVADENLEGAIRLFSTLYQAGYMEDSIVEHFAERLMNEHSSLDVNVIGYYSRMLYDGRVDRVLFNPWPWIFECLKTNDLGRSFVSLFSYTLVSKQFTRELAERLVRELQPENMPADMLPLFLHQFSHLARFGGYWRLLEPMLEKAFPIVEQCVTTQTLHSNDCAWLIQSLCNTRPPVKWLDTLMPYILGNISELNASSACSVIYTLGKGIGKDDADRHYISYARRLLDAYSTIDVAGKFSAADMSFFCNGLSMLQVRHAPWLHEMATKLIENKKTLCRMSGVELCHVLEGMTSVNFRHTGLLDTTAELLQSKEIEFDSWRFADCLGVACALLHSKTWSGRLLERVFSASDEDIWRLSRYSFTNLVLLCSLVSARQDIKVTGLNEMMKGPIDARSKKDFVRSQGQVRNRKREDRLLNLVESLLPHHSFLARFTRVSGQIPVHGALLIDENQWPVSWNDAPLQPTAVSPTSLVSFHHKAIAIVLLNSCDTLGDALATPCGSVLLKIAALKAAGWWVITLPIEGLDVAHGSSTIFRVREELTQAGMQLPTQQNFSLPAKSLDENAADKKPAASGVSNQEQMVANEASMGQERIKIAPERTNVSRFK